MNEPDSAEQPLRILGRYALYGKLAAGGMATVHFGRLLGPAGFSRTVAIKRLHPQFSKDPEFVAMFLDEARLAARIQHPNVVATVDVVAMAEELFLVMDYVRGESFSKLVRASRKKGIDVPLGIICSIVAGMLHGLHAAHEARDERGQPLAIVHRDVSPQNLLVGADGIPRVLDFGVAKAAARVQVTRDGQMKGKLSYMAPEQLKARGVDRRTDVFAAAIVLWEALTGRRLFDAEEASEVLHMILAEPVPPPSAVVPTIPRTLDEIVLKGLASDPKERYQTAREFAIALEDAIQLASPRAIGEWVERVAGDTLSRREQTVAEIESVSSVSEVSLVTDSEPGFMKTLDGLETIRQPARRTAPTNGHSSAKPGSFFDPKPPSGRLASTKVRIPRPASTPPPEDDKTTIYDRTISEVIEPADEATLLHEPARTAGDEEDEATTVLDPATTVLDPATAVFDPASSLRPIVPVPATAGKLEPPAIFRRQTTLLGLGKPPPSAPTNGAGHPPQAVPAKLAGSPDSDRRTPNGTSTDVEAVTEQTGERVPSVIVSETDTEPRLRPPSTLARYRAWLLEPNKRTSRVAAVTVGAGLVVLVTTTLLSAAIRSVTLGTERPAAPATAPQASSLAAQRVVKVEPPPPTPEGVDPSTLPLAPPESEATETTARSFVGARGGAPAARGASAATTTASAAVEPTSLELPEASDDDELLESPYSVSKASAPARPRRRSRTSASGADSKPAADTPSSSTTAKPAHCAQPYRLDEDGIRRVKPECL